MIFDSSVLFLRSVLKFGSAVLGIVVIYCPSLRADSIRFPQRLRP